MNKILFDLSVCQPIGKSKFHGGGVYGYIVFKALASKYPKRILAYYDDTCYIPADIIDLIKNNDISFEIKQKNSLVELYNRKKFEKLYSPLWSNSYFRLFDFNVPIILTQHGLRALEMNRDSFEQIYANSKLEYFKSILKKTGIYHFIQKRYYKSFEKIFKYENIKIVTVSEHSKASILHYFPFVDKDNIKVFYSPNTSGEIITKPDYKDKYYLIVSANRWLKNAYRAILAFDKIFQNNKDMEGTVIVTGIADNSRLLLKLKNRNRFLTKGYMERDVLEQLYQNAYALIYPSLNEGFGYPPIEVMKYGIPVIASSFASISEICGDAPLYVNPYSIDEICMRILELEDDTIYKNKKLKSERQYQLVKSKQEQDLDNLVEYIIN